MYKSFVSLGRYIPKYFILFVAMVNGIVSLISLSVFSLLVYKNPVLYLNCCILPMKFRMELNSPPGSRRWH